MHAPEDHIAGQRVTVVGLGKSGLSVARFCHRQGARVTVTDRGARDHFADEVRELEDLGIALEFGAHREAAFQGADMVVLSPGVPHTIAPVAAARRRGVPVIGEMELAARRIAEPIVAVTGTNGKTTTTALLGRMLAASGFSVFVGGNIGTPLIDYVDQKLKKDWLVIEVSSFQLDTIERFRPRIGVLLNISADHLDRYADFEAYAASKMRLFVNQIEGDIAVVNGDDALCRKAPGRPAVRSLAFGTGADAQARIGDRQITFRPPAGDVHTIDLTRWPLAGRHNRENAAAAGLGALAAGAGPEGLQAAIDGFEGLPHRLALVRTHAGVRYYNDSKATNVDAVCRALEGFEAPVVLIMGGRDKGGSYQALEPLITARVRSLVVLGEAAERITAEFQGLVPTLQAADMADAVRLAADQAVRGDVVLLSPACASFDMYASYNQRGEDFCRHVQALT